jgi:hypothetical protein
MDLVVDAAGRVEVEARDFPVNRGGLCQKGWTAAALLDHEQRLTTPLMRDRRGAELRSVSLDDALDRIAAEIGRCQQRHGREAVGVFGGGGLTNEKAYVLGKFARVALRTPSIDYNGRFCMSSAAVAAQRAFGLDRGLPFPLADVARTDAILLVGGNPAETLPLAVPYLDEQRSRGGQLVVIDPRVTASTKYVASPAALLLALQQRLARLQPLLPTAYLVLGHIGIAPRSEARLADHVRTTLIRTGADDHARAERRRIDTLEGGLRNRIVEEALAAAQDDWGTQIGYSSIRSCRISVCIRSALP